MADAAPPVPQVQQQQQQQQQPVPQPPTQQVNLHMNWSHFKPEYSGNQRKMLRPIY